MKPEVRTCTEDGWVITKNIDNRGDQTVHANSTNAWKQMCLDCRAYIDGHISLTENSGSKQPPEVGENPRGKKEKGKKKPSN